MMPRAPIQRFDWPIAILSVMACSIIAFYAGERVERWRCEQIGGRLARFGMDHLCLAADGSRLPLRVMPSTRTGLAAVFVVYGAAITVFYRSLIGWIRRPPRTTTKSP
jgi:hypothetical protein